MDAVKPMIVLALNSGSSSLKFGLYRVTDSALEMLLEGEAESIGGERGEFRVRTAQTAEWRRQHAAIAGPEAALLLIEKCLADSRLPAPQAIGHRVVHGGPELLQHCLIDEAVVRQIEAATAFAPLHTPSAVAVIRHAQKQYPGLPQVACFDTSFHAGMPEVARLLPIPRNLQQQGLQRYGFHGLSCESIVHQLAAGLPSRLVIAHLGNGASVTAVKAGKSIDTSMGLTPTGGCMMGTRSGDLDPGVLLYLMREQHFDAAMLADLVDHRSGLLGVSGIASDMRLLHEAADTNSDAMLAIHMFCTAVCKQIAGMITVLNGADMIVFTGGIGEHDTKVRAAICEGLAWMGVIIDEQHNRSAKNPLSTATSRCAIWVLASQEDEQIARHTWRLALHG